MLRRLLTYYEKVGSCEDHNEPPHSIKYREFLDDLSNYELVKKVTFLWSCLVTSLLN